MLEGQRISQIPPYGLQNYLAVIMILRAKRLFLRGGRGVSVDYGFGYEARRDNST
jgi:hypothetical protein